MLTREENETLCRVGPGRAMGGALRHYWLPALLSSTLSIEDCVPQHVELLGEHFVAFRDSSGQVGLLDEKCCHRGASLTLGRIEGCGIRCIYHGWKFAIDGTVLETPNVPDPKFKDRFKAKAYPVKEAGGLIWTYLGDSALPPPFPTWAWFDIPAVHRISTVHIEECSFVQALEGLVDSSHLNILHSNGMRASTESGLVYAEKLTDMQFDPSPVIEVEDTAFGFYYAALRRSNELNDGSANVRHARITAFIAPCCVLNANGNIATFVVPANDERCMFYHVFWDTSRALGEEPLRSEHLRFVGLDQEAMDAFGISPETHSTSNRPGYGNRFHQDREAMRSRSFSGIAGLIEEDVAVSVSAGPIRDRTREMLARSDIAVGRLARVLLTCARRAEQGHSPVGVGADVGGVEGFSAELTNGGRWQELVSDSG